jgi:hypothetical protein
LSERDVGSALLRRACKVISRERIAVVSTTREQIMEPCTYNIATKEQEEEA